jgi:hypothetical protein
VSELSFQPATRQTVRPLIGLFGLSGGGKTMTALLVARGIVGPNGRIGLVDTENGRGSYFSDLIPGGYSVLNLDPPFSPEHYGEALHALESSIDIGVIDSMTHEWNGENGYLDQKEAALERMAGQDWKKREKCAMAAAAQCKPKHNRLVQQMLRLRIPLILCFRGKDRVKPVKNADGKTEIVSDNFASPIQDSGLIFEMLIAGEVFAREEAPDVGGYFRPTKITHPGIRPLLPSEGEQFGVKHGEAIARWAESPGGKPSVAPADKPKAPKARLWAWAQSKGYSDPAAFERWLAEESIISESETLAGLTPARIEEVLERLNK